MYRLLTALLIALVAPACSVWQPITDLVPDQARHCIGQFSQTQQLSRVQQVSTEGLAGTVRLLNWNLQKGAQSGWEAQLETLSRDRDLLLVQEAIAGSGSSGPLAAYRHRHFAPGYHDGTQQTGVLTASRVAPLGHCNLSATEPWLGTPKATAITRFPIAGSAQHLLVANIHSVNFSLGIEQYRQQLQAVVSILATHSGPIIFAGDFNTWNDRRLDLLQAAAQQLSLTAITFAEDSRKRFLGKPLDHILVRGLMPVASRTLQTDFSDHNPLLAALTWTHPPLRAAAAPATGG